MAAATLVVMAGGMKRGSGKQLGERSGHPREPMTWEFPDTVEPTDAHVLLDLGDGRWVQALVIEMRRESDGWRVRVAWADRGDGESRVRNEWVPAARVRPRAAGAGADIPVE